MGCNSSKGASDPSGKRPPKQLANSSNQGDSHDSPSKSQ
jgi:hypothetical protein